MTAIGAPVKQPATQQSASDITSDSVLQYLADSKGTESFDEYQASKAKTQSTMAPNVSQVDVDDDNDADLQQAL